MVNPSEGRRPTVRPSYSRTGFRLSALECRAAVRIAEHRPEANVTKGGHAGATTKCGMKHWATRRRSHKPKTQLGVGY